jgi:competence protein ComEC
MKGQRSLLAALCFLLVLGAPVVASGSYVQAEDKVQAQNCVDINRAGPQELQQIRHIGPARAEQIITLRQQRAFRTVDELSRVNGIAAARLRDIKAQGLACVASGSG